MNNFKIAANQIYQSWAFRNNVNVFAAGSNLAPAVATGSGYFLGRAGNVFTVFSENPLRDFYAMRIVKNPKQDNDRFKDVPVGAENTFKSLNFGRDLINDFITESIDLKIGGLKDKKLCHEEHCCNFTIDHEATIPDETFQYRLVAFNGYRTYSGWGDKRLIICAIMVCNNGTIDSCGRLPDYDLDQITFNRLEISTTFNRFGVLMMPNSLDMNMDSLKVSEFVYSEVVDSETSRTSSMKLLKPHADLQAFALYAHDYETEDEFIFELEDETGGSARNYASLKIFLVILLVELLY